MASRRSPHLRRVNLLIGGILIIAGVAGGFLLTFWFLVILLPITCVCASWMMASTVQRGQEAHIIGALLLTTLFVGWLGYFVVHGAESLTWYGIFLISGLLLIQAALHLSVNRQVTDTARIDDENLSTR